MPTRSSPTRKMQALGRMQAGRMNKTEQAYEQRLADSTFYKPDFLVMAADGTLEVHEVKGHWADDARVKIKVAAELYPFRFLAVQRAGTGWKVEEF